MLYFYGLMEEINRASAQGAALPAPLCLSSNADFDWIAARPIVVNGSARGLPTRAQVTANLARIVLPDSAGVVPWKKFRRTLRPEVRATIEMAIKAGSRSFEWQFTAKPIPASEWLGIQALQSGQWVDV